MPESQSVLDSIEIKSPCSMNWERMTGDDRVRHCRACRLNVFNLSGMTRDEAEALVVRSEGRLCVRYHRRPDGTILTKDCGAVVATRKRRRLAASVLFLLGVLATAIAASRHDAEDWTDYDRMMRREQYIRPLRALPAIGYAVNKLLPEPQIMMGEMVCPPAPAAAPASTPVAGA